MGIQIHNGPLGAPNGPDRSRAELARHASRLSSGLRIASAGDDPSSAAVADLLRADVASYRQALRNLNDTAGMLQTADGAMGQIGESLLRMRQLASQASNTVLSPEQKQMVAEEFNAQAEQIDSIIDTTDHNDLGLLNGQAWGGVDLTGLTGMVFSVPEDAVGDVDAALGRLTRARAGAGALMGQLEQEARRLSAQTEASLASGSRIEDVDAAREMAGVTGSQIALQAALAVQAHAASIEEMSLQLVQ